MQLDEITIQQLGVIDTVQLAVAQGLTVISGETGAGKTMLVTALQLALGARADQNLVRDGATKATIDVVFSDGDFAGHADDGVVVITREIPVDGRASARVNGRPVTVGVLEEMFTGSVEVHAQHTHARLARREVQRDLLDRYAGDAHLIALQQYRETYETYRQIAQQYDALQSSAVERERERDRLQFEADEIAAAEIDPSTDSVIDEQIAKLGRVDELFDAASQAAVLLDSDHSGVPLGEAIHRLRAVRDVDTTLAELAVTLDTVQDQLVELSRAFRHYADRLDTDPAALSALNERKHLLAGLCRKYGPTLDDVIKYHTDAMGTLAALDTQNLDRLAKQRDDAFGALQAAAQTVRAGRQQAAAELADNVRAHLRDLGMPHATFSVVISPDEPHRHGADNIEFLLAPNPGERPTPIADAVSGGERSRVALALEVALADIDDADILVFDEVDAGIGGQTAFAVGEKLARLAKGVNGRSRQVMCVTHLAQLAVFADLHYVVEKDVRDGRTHTTVRAVAHDEREQELSRLLGGVVAHEGIEHARMLLDTAKDRVAAQK